VIERFEGAEPARVAAGGGDRGEVQAVRGGPDGGGVAGGREEGGGWIGLEWNGWRFLRPEVRGVAVDQWLPRRLG